MKNVIIVILIVAVLIFALLCFNSCRKNSKEDENISETVSTVSEIAEEETITETNNETSVTSGQSENIGETSSVTTGSETGGGNPDVYDVIEITVSEDKYFYKNEEITLDKFKEITKSMDVNTTVEIRDELATYKAYSELIDYLDEKGILYSEEE